MELEMMREVVKMCDFMEYTFMVQEDTRGSITLRGWYDEVDTTTGTIATQYTRRWLLSPLMTKSEIVQTVFKCALASMEHRTREWFKYQKRAVFGPHYDVDVLHLFCRPEFLDFREPPTTRAELVKP